MKIDLNPDDVVRFRWVSTSGAFGEWCDTPAAARAGTWHLTSKWWVQIEVKEHNNESES